MTDPHMNNLVKFLNIKWQNENLQLKSSSLISYKNLTYKVIESKLEIQNLIFLTTNQVLTHFCSREHEIIKIIIATILNVYKHITIKISIIFKYLTQHLKLNVFTFKCNEINGNMFKRKRRPIKEIKIGKLISIPLHNKK